MNGKFLRLFVICSILFSFLPAMAPVQAQRYTQVFPEAAVTQGQSQVRQAPLQTQIYYTAPAVEKQSMQSAEAIVQRLLAANNLAPNLVRSVQVVDDDSLNAATNGQDIIITRGLWNRLGTNDQRAFVLGHELAHIVEHHIGQTQARRIGLTLLDRLVLGRYIQSGSLLDVASNIGLGLIDRRSSRTLEYKADDRGMQLITKAGYRPQSALEVFSILENASKNTTPEFLLSHPISRSRVQALVNKYKLAAQ